MTRTNRDVSWLCRYPDRDVGEKAQLGMRWPCRYRDDDDDDGGGDDDDDDVEIHDAHSSTASSSRSYRCLAHISSTKHMNRYYKW